MNILSLDQTTQSEIQNFVTTFDGLTVFQLPIFLHVLERTRDHEGYWIGLEDNDEIIGSVIFFDVIHSTPVPGVSARRRVVIGGPLIKSSLDNPCYPEYVRMMLDEVIGRNRKPFFVEIRNTFDTQNIMRGFELVGFHFEDHLNYIIDLSKEEDELLRDMSSSGRRMVKKSLKEGLIVQNGNSLKEIEEFYGVISEMYSRKELPLADISLFKSCFEVLGNQYCRYFLAKDETERVVAGRLELIAGGTMFDWYAAADSECLAKRPNELLIWSALTEGKRLGLSRFDFGGAGRIDEEYGVREFKRKFGGQEVNYGRYFIPVRPIATSIARKGLKLVMRFRKR